MHSSSTLGRAKGSRLVGGAVTEEALDSSASVLERRGARVRAGLQQFFSLPEAPAFCRVITGVGDTVVECNRYGSSLNEASERCTRCGGAGRW